MKQIGVMIIIFICSLNLAWSALCGVEGTIKERIYSCNTQNNNWLLVSRSNSFKNTAVDRTFYSDYEEEVWLDLDRGIMWSDAVDTFDQSWRATNSSICNFELRSHNHNTIAIGGIDNFSSYYKWKTPNLLEWIDALNLGLSEVSSLESRRRVNHLGGHCNYPKFKGEITLPSVRRSNIYRDDFSQTLSSKTQWQGAVPASERCVQKVALDVLKELRSEFTYRHQEKVSVDADLICKILLGREDAFFEE